MMDSKEKEVLYRTGSGDPYSHPDPINSPQLCERLPPTVVPIPERHSFWRSLQYTYAALCSSRRRP
jgi:hypothetical protein